MRTLPAGAVCIADAAGGTLIHVDPSGDQHATAVPAGGRLLDFLGLGDGTWALLDDGSGARRIAHDGTLLWSSDARLRGLLCDAEGALFGVSDARLVALDAETGAPDELQALDGADGPWFMNGAGRVGYQVESSWVTVDARSGERSEIRLEERSGMDYPIGLDADGRSYWNRFATLRRLAPDGRADWEFEAGQAIVDGDRVWVQQRPAGELVALALDANASPIALPLPAGEERAWSLVGREPGDSFVLYGNDTGVLARIGPNGSVEDISPAGNSVWLDWFEMQRPRGAAVTDAGELDIATRSPDGLHLIRLTPR
jgi:outer membrane protein assembly factor BamB